jgi:hypothetical protein
MSQIPYDAELTGIESALGGLMPVTSGLDRDRLMFRAGALSQARSRRSRWVWPSLAALLSLVVTCESVYLAARPAPRVIERIVVVHEPAPTTTPTDSSPPITVPTRVPERSDEPRESLAFLTEIPNSESRRLQAMVLRFGLDAFPEPVRRPAPSGRLADPPDSPPATAGDLRRIELERILNLGDRS